MRDLTQGRIPGHLLHMAVPISVGMLAQTLYFLVDVYFVAQLSGRDRKFKRPIVDAGCVECGRWPGCALGLDRL